MQFYVHAQDRPGVGDELEKLVEEHWSYMDRFADALVLRGPTLSDDGEEHTGSVHVVEVADRADAERFAAEEPFWRAGLYARLTTVRADVLLHRERTGDAPREDVPKTLVGGEWAARPRTGRPLLGPEPDGRLGFVAALVDDDGARGTGIVAVVRALPEEARALVQPFADGLAGGPVALTARRWLRGGRR